MILSNTTQNVFAPSLWRPAFEQAKLYTAGYSLDDPNYQRYSLGQFTATRGNLIAHTCDTSAGQSGSPVFAYGSTGTRLIAVHVYGYQDYSDVLPGQVNKAVMLNSEILDWVGHILNQLAE